MTPTEIRLKLRALGYAPIPVSGKRPSMEGWQTKLGVNADEIKLWERLYPYDQNTGALTRNTPCLDIDITDENAAEAVEALACEHFANYGAFLVRTGKAPKRAVFFQTDQPFKKLLISLTALNGMAHKIEFLGDGQQAVVDGVHPETGQPYVWRGGTLADVRHDELPGMTEESARDFLAQAGELLVREHGYKVEGAAKPDAVDETADKASADWPKLTANILTGVELHDSLRDLAASYLAGGVTEDAARRLLETLMLQVRPDQRDNRWVERWREIPRAVRSAAMKFGKPAEAASLAFCDIAAWAQTEPPDSEWGVPNRFPLRNVSILSGEGAVGKSIVFMQLAAALKLETGWLNTLPEPGPVIYLNAEDEEAELHRRMLAIARHYNTSLNSLIGHLNILSLIGQDAVLGYADRHGLIRPTPLFAKLKEAACDIRPRIIGLDTLADIYAGSEIDRSQVRQFINLLRQIAVAANSAVIIMAHPSLTGISSGTGLSGSTAWHNSVRGRAYLTSIKDDDGASDLRYIEFLKNNYGRRAESLTLRWNNGVYVPESVSTFERAAAEANAEHQFLTLLASLMGKNLSDKPKAPNYAPTLFARMTPADGKRFSKTQLENAMLRLFAANKIHLQPYGPPSRGFIRLAPGPRQETTHAP